MPNNTEQTNVDDLLAESMAGDTDMDIDAIMASNQDDDLINSMMEEASSDEPQTMVATSTPKKTPRGIKSPDDLSMTLKAVVGTTEITLGELEKLSSGKYLELDTFKHSPVILEDVKGVKCATGRISLVGNQYRIEILDTESEGSDS